MPSTFPVLTAVLLYNLLAPTVLAKPIPETINSGLSVCAHIAKAVSPASDVYYAGHPLYYKDIHHWSSISTQFPLCTVEPGTSEDVASILRIVGSTRTPFAVMGGGHATNPGFSSTTGVHIAMYRFSEVTYDSASETATIGAGLVWDDVYEALEPHGVNVIGGRVTGVGVAGFTLGGGYSWKSNQHGLTMDTVTKYELVKPDGVVEDVTQESDSELFFALKGGYNNFGIVTRFTLKTFPQSKVWGGTMVYTRDKFDEVNSATHKFATQVTDTKASILTTYTATLGIPAVLQFLFYDAPTPPAGIFDDFLKIPSLVHDIQEERTFTSLVQSAPSNGTSGTRAVFNTISLAGPESYSKEFLAAVVNETEFWGTRFAADSGFFIAYGAQPFRHSVYQAGLTTDTAYPPSREVNPQPVEICWIWTLPSADADVYAAIRQSAQRLREVAGQGSLSGYRYPNYAIHDTELEHIYGKENLRRLKAVKTVVDPDGIMNLAGGFKLD